MTIVHMLRVGDHSPWRAIGEALYTLSRNHVVQFDGIVGIGFGFDNCNAAVAVDRVGATAAGYHDAPALAGNGAAINGLDFGAIYGSSRLYAGLDPVANGIVTPSNSPFSSSLLQQHAEQTAILVAQGLGIGFWASGEGYNHVYVDFTPCIFCDPWLRARGENWVVHYGIALAQKTDFTVKRKKVHRVERQSKWKMHWMTLPESHKIKKPMGKA